MEELFNILASSARIDKSNRKRKKPETVKQITKEQNEEIHDEEQEQSTAEKSVEEDLKSRDRTGKRDISQAKLDQVHKEQIVAFRRAMNIRLANKHDPNLPDPVTCFKEIPVPSWWSDDSAFRGILRSISRNVEAGRWKEPTPIQMQAVPTLMERRDFIGAAPTGSGKSGAFLIPALLLSGASFEVFYGATAVVPVKTKKMKKMQKHDESGKEASREGQIRALILAPSLELASQLHREVERLGTGKTGGLSTLRLSKSNAPQVITGVAGGKKGLDVLIATPMRLVDSIEKGLKLNSVRMVVLDEADRLLDATDGKRHNEISAGVDDDEEEEPEAPAAQRSARSQSFLSQMDVILCEIPNSAVRALFSATVTPMVRSLSESILRNPVDVTVAPTGTQGGANPDIEQELSFVGREEGKLLAIRQLVQRGQLRPPVIIFLQSQERAQALFGELLYDGIHVDVIHAGRSKTARENSVAKFRKGETWVLICTDLVARGVDFRAVNMVINYDVPSSGVAYVHRIGRTGRAGRKGKAITLFTEADFENLRMIANVMKQSGCHVADWMLTLPSKRPNKQQMPRRRKPIDTTPSYDKKKRQRKKQMVDQSKKKQA